MQGFAVPAKAFRASPENFMTNLLYRNAFISFNDIKLSFLSLPKFQTARIINSKTFKQQDF